MSLPHPTTRIPLLGPYYRTQLFAHTGLVMWTDQHVVNQQRKTFPTEPMGK